MFTAMQKLMIISAIILIAIIPLYLFVVVPELGKIPSDFHYEADVFSIDNFYDEEAQDFSGEINSNTKFSYEVVRIEDDVLIIKNIFDVRTPRGDPIFTVERLYGIDPKTGKHVAGYGDKDREGYLFAPRNLNKQNYVYWHINYDNPANMVFQDEEEVFGLKVYRYETDYHADQTVNLGHLSGVPEERGVNLDINLQVWVEPETGRMIKYEDNTIAYYYDIETGERIHPWNKFNNVYKDSSIIRQIKIAEAEKQNMFLYGRLIPIILAIMALGLLAVSYYYGRKK